jgi:long-chain fatty acid transport protein
MPPQCKNGKSSQCEDHGQSFVGSYCETEHKMKPRNYQLLRLSLFVAGALILICTGHARGAGLSLYETGAPDLGTAQAGQAALAADASTVGSNPAGMTLLDRTQLLVAAGAMLPTINFHPGSQTTTGGTGGGNAGVFFPLGGSFFVYKLSDRWRLGVAAGSNFGLAVDYGKQWAGRYYLTESSIITGQVNPAVAYRVNRWLSVGAGFSIVVGRLFDEAKINNALPRIPDGGLSLESWSVSAGGNAGILIQPNEKIRFGLTYTSPVDFTFGFNPHTTGLGPGLEAALRKSGAIGAKLNLDMTEPQQMMSSVLYQLTPKFALMGDLGWQNWSAFGQTVLGISAKNQRTLAVDMHFSDTWHTAIGGQYRIGERCLWSVGFAYDSSPVSEANRTPALPLDRQLRYGTGIQYILNDNITVGAANEITDGGKAPYNAMRGPLAGRLQGGFPNNLLDFLAANLSWKF